MKLFKAHRWALVAAAVLAGPALLEAQVLRCNMTNPCGTAPAPGCAGCGVLSSVWHASAFPCSPGAGSFNLIGTHFENTCSLGVGCPVLQPVMRFWQYDFYAKANNGCQRQDDTQQMIEWLVNAFLDDGSSPAPGHWYMYQAGWAGTLIDGCYNAVLPAPPQPPARTVVEISSVDSRAGFEGTNLHTAWYVIGSVPLTQQFEFDTITGGTGCNAGEIEKQPVPGLTIGGRVQPCNGSATPTTSQTNDTLAGFFTTTVTISDPNPDWWNESGMNGAPTLIAGFQILYTTGVEPTSSNLGTGGWQPVYDPADGTLPKNALGVVPRGTATPVTISLPITAPATNYWLALRIVYQDATENPLGPFDPAVGTPTVPVGPQITTPVGPHCGPVNFNPGVVTAVEFGSVVAERTPQGVNVTWTTLSEDDTNGFKVFRSNDEAGTEAVTEAASWVDAHGANLEYTISDLGAGNGAYYYYVQELTSDGFGDRSASVRVEPTTATTGQQGGASGGRSRGSSRR